MKIHAPQKSAFTAPLHSLQKRKDKTSQFVADFVKHLESIDNISVCSDSRRVTFQGESLSLLRKDKLFFLFQLMHSHKKDGIDRQHLMAELYPSAPISSYESYSNSQSHNTIKLISRARTLARKHFSKVNQNIEWFPYNSLTKKWTLCRPHVKNMTDDRDYTESFL